MASNNNGMSKSPSTHEMNDLAEMGIEVEAITLPHPPAQTQLQTHGRTPSYSQSQYETIIRRQRARTGRGELKLPNRYLRQQQQRRLLRHHSDEDDDHDEIVEEDEEGDEHVPNLIHKWQFSGWGSVQFIEISTTESETARKERLRKKDRNGDAKLGKFMASAVAGVAVAGSPLYAFPALVGVASVYSPIALLIATSLLIIWRPIMKELASAFAIDGSNYVYLLNSSSTKTFAIVAAALTLLDDVCTTVVGAATGAAYVPVEWNVPWMTVILIVVIGLIALCGVKGSAEVMTSILFFHLATLFVLAIFGIVHWAKEGNEVLRTNWIDNQAVNGREMVKQIWLGICVAFLGVTGFETAPDYLSSVRPGTYPTVLSVLQIIAITINAPLMLITFAVLPIESILGDDSVLKAVAHRSAGPWLSIWISVDAVCILCATILSGIIAANALLCRVAEDGLLPRFLLLRLPRTGAPFLSLACFCALCLVIYASTGASLTVISSIFAIVFLSIMGLYPIASLLLSFHRPHLPRKPGSSLYLNLLALSLTIAFIVGNFIIAPATNSIFFAYALVLILAFWIMSRKSRLMLLAWWFVDQNLWMKKLGWDKAVIRWIKKSKEKSILVFVESDEVDKLYEMLSYVQTQEETSFVKLVHCYKSIADIPSELEANYKILDESFPSITIDLLLVEGSFSPDLLDVICVRTGVQVSDCFVGCFSKDSEWSWDSFGGVRIVGV